MSTLCIYCAGGLGRDFLSLLQAEKINYWDNFLFVDDVSTEQTINQVKILTFQDILNKKKKDYEFVILNGEPLYREQLYKKILKYNFRTSKIIFHSSVISPDSIIKKGVIIHCQSIISSRVKIDENAFIGKKAMIGHDVTIGKHSVISACSYIGGWANIGQRSFIGAGALIRDRITIGKNCIIGIGSVVTKDVPNNTVVAGNPAKYLRMNNNNRVFHQTGKHIYDN